METRLRLVLPAWTGLVLVVLGALLFFASYFLLPVAVGGCFDSYCGWHYATTWEFSLAGLSSWEFYVNGLPHLDSSLVTDTIVLVLYYLPLLAAATVVAGSVGSLVWPHRALATWGHRAWLTGSIALTFLLFFSRSGQRSLGADRRVGVSVCWSAMACYGQATVSLPHSRIRDLIGHDPMSIEIEDHAGNGVGLLDGRGILQLSEATQSQRLSSMLY